MTTDTSERGLERLICTALTGSRCESDAASGGTCASGGRSTDDIGCGHRGRRFAIVIDEAHSSKPAPTAAYGSA